MTKKLRGMAGVAAWLSFLFTGIGPAAAADSDTVTLVKAPERSGHFAAVQKQLELGGTLYAYADVDGDVFKLADALRGVMEQVAETQPEAAPYLKQDYRALATIMGLDDIKAFGLSSVPAGDGTFRNRVFFLTPNGRHGFLAGLGGAPAPYTMVKLAPADADFYGEAEMDLAQVYTTLQAVVTKVGGETAANLMADRIKEAGVKASIPWLDVINAWKGRTAMVLRLDSEKTLLLPNFVIPRPSFLLCIEGIAPAFEPLLKKSKGLKMTQEKGRKIYRSAQPLPMPGVDPVIVIEGKTIYVATTPEFFKECLEHTSGLAETPEFKTALGKVSATGNSLAYVSPAFFARMHDLERLNPDLPAKNAQTLRFLLQNVPQPTLPLIAVRTNLPDGILVQSNLNRSLKQDVAMIAVYNPATLGLMAAMAIPAFQKVRTSAQEKAVLNNLRQIAAAADQYYLENNVDTVDLDKLVGPDAFIRELKPVAGEDYGELVLKSGEPLVVHFPDGREVRYEP
jgi:type IV pilus assembly protein PilA